MPQELEIEVNGKLYRVHSHPETPLLDVLREELGFTGAKYGCGEGQCAACTVLLGDTPRRSCQIPVSVAAGKSITTIEGLEKDGRLHPVQQAFLDAGAFQCAYCTSGMIMSAFALLQKKRNPSDDEIIRSMNGNICRCGAYSRIIAAIKERAGALHGGVK